MNNKINKSILALGAGLYLTAINLSTQAYGEAVDQKSIALPSLQIVASVSAPTVTPDKPIALKVSLRNNSDRIYTYSDVGGLLKEFKVDIRDGDGNIVPLTQYGKAAGPSSLEGMMDKNRPASVASKGQTTFSIWLNRDFDMSRSGDYHITVSRKVGADWLPASQPTKHTGQYAWGEIVSNPVTVTVSVVVDQDIIKSLEHD